MAHLYKTGLTLTEAVEHSKRIKTLECNICGCIVSDSYDRTEMVQAIRGQGYCASCTFDARYNPRTPEERYS